MSAIKTEKVFPRGGSNPALSKHLKAPNFSLFDKFSKKNKKKNKKKKEGRVINEKHSETSVNDELIVKYVDELSPSTLHEGMLVLGIISKITDKVVLMSLPGGMKGVVKIFNISKFYKEIILNSSSKSEVINLKDIFKVGEILPAKVISVSQEDKFTYYLTLDPEEVNSKINEIETGVIIMGIVKSEEDHGYIIDFGVSTITSFLHFDKIPNEGKLKIGKLIRCIVIECSDCQGCYHVELSLLPEDLNKGTLSTHTTYPIHSFVPGLQFNITVERVLKNGLEVSFKDDKSKKGLVYEDHLPSLFPKLEKIKVGTKYVGTLLYVKPLVNIPYFKILSHKPQNWIYHYGQIVKGTVVRSSRSGVIFRIGTKLIPMKCFVPFMKLANADKLMENNTAIETLYPLKKVVSQIRLGMIDYMRRCYFGATDKASLQEKYYSVSDLKCGQIVPCTVTSISASNINVKIGKTISGTIANMDLTDIPRTNSPSLVKVDQKVFARVMEIHPETCFVRLTMKPTFMKKKIKLLTSYTDAKKDSYYTGTIFIVKKKKIIVKFFNGVMGHVPQHLTPYKNSASLKMHYSPGQLVKCLVMQNDGNTNLQLSLLSKDYTNFKFSVGEKYEVIVGEKNKAGLIIHIQLQKDSDFMTGILPSELLSEYPGLGKDLMEIYSVNDKFMAYNVLNIKGNDPVFAISENICRFYETLAKKKVKSADLLKVGQILPFLFTFIDFKSNRLVVSPILPNLKSKRFYVNHQDISDDGSFKYLNMNNLPLKKFQLVYGKIIKEKNSEFDVSLKMSDVWDKNFHGSLALLDSYLDGIKKLIYHHKEMNENYVKKVTLGSEASGILNLSKDANDVICELDNVLHNSLKQNASGKIIKGKVVWIKAEEKRICINTSRDCISDINLNQDNDIEFIDAICRARIVYVGKEVVVAALKGKGHGKLVFLPRKRHTNDFNNSPSPYTVGCLTKVWVERGKLNNLVAIDREVTLLVEKKIWNSHENVLRNSIKALKRKLPVEDSERKIQRLCEQNDQEVNIIDMKLSVGRPEIKAESTNYTDDDIQCEFNGIEEGVMNGNILNGEIKEEIEESEDGEAENEGNKLTDEINSIEVDIKSENESDADIKDDAENDIYNKERILFSSNSEESDCDDGSEAKNENEKNVNLNIGFNWDVLQNRELLSGAIVKSQEELSSNDEEESRNTKKKRVRLTKCEKEEKAKAEEERLRLIEERLMNANLEPETADDFDRAVLGKPNSSALWLKYMAFYLQATEIEKARAVARRALKSIAFNEEQEKLNIWVALLNLENLYGNEETINKTLGQALMCNEPYYIHLHMLNMRGQCNKFQEMEKLGNMLMKKFKDVENVWEDVGLAYYKVGKIESSRKVLQRALQNVDRKRHVEIISKFAQLENKYGSSERAQTLYETILASFPKRVDIWSCYVDMLVKNNQIDVARQVLERATSQCLPPKKMKILFKKFIAFEEKHGTSENVDKVRESAVEYVETMTAMIGK